MNPEGTLVELAEAQWLFETLPRAMRMPSLSPAYVAADALRDPLLTPCFLVWRKGGALLMHFVHEAQIPGRTEFDWQSAYGYGGPLTSGLAEADIKTAWGALDAIAGKRRIVAEFVRFHPLIENQRAYPGTVRPDRPVVSLQLSDANLLGRYSGRARTAVRKALSDGLALQWESGAEARRSFPPFYREGMRQIEASPFYLFGDEYFNAILAMPGARVASVLQEGARLAMGVFLFGQDVAEYHLSAVSQEGRRSNATNLLLHGAAQAAQEAGMSELYLGGGTSADPDNSLLRFKSSFASPTSTFSVGYRIHDPHTYSEIRKAFPGEPTRVLFYR